MVIKETEKVFKVQNSKVLLQTFVIAIEKLNKILPCVVSLLPWISRYFEFIFSMIANVALCNFLTYYLSIVIYIFLIISIA